MGAGERQIPVIKPGMEMMYPHAQQPNADEVSRKLYAAVEPALVQIKGDDNKSGTGFFVGDKNQIVTSAHVVLGSKEQFVIGRDGKRYKAQVDAVDDINNLAVLSIKGQAPEHGSLTLQNGTKIAKDQRLQAFGFPADVQSAYTAPGSFHGYTNRFNYLKDNFKSVLPPLAEKVKGMDEDEKLEAVAMMKMPLIQGTVSLRRGFGGGPLLDADGNVKGIVNMINPRDPNDAFFTPAEFAQPLIDGKDPKFSFKYEQKRAEWADQYMSDWAHRPMSAVVETGFGAGGAYLGYRLLNRMPGVGGAAVGVAGLTMFAGDASKYLNSTDSADSWKFGLASVADLGTTGGAVMSMIPKARGVGLAVMGVGIVGRAATDFFKNRWELEEVKRTDGSDRAPLTFENLLKK